MATVLDIYNAAISAARGKGRLVTTADNTKPAEECNIWYPFIRDQLQEAAYWPACRQTNRLTVITTRDFSINWNPGDPETQYKYAYGLPSDCQRPWWLVDYSHFTLSFDPTTDRTILSTNSENAVLIYAAQNNNPTQWTPGQRLGTIYALAAAIGPNINGDPAFVAQNYALANQHITQARVDAANSNALKINYIPPALQIRSHPAQIEGSAFFYPYGELFSAASPNA